MLSLIKILFTVVWKEVLGPVVRYFLNRVGGRVLEIARETVTSIMLDPSLISDDKKRSEAFRIIKDKLRAEGLEARDSTINLAIELAVSATKKRMR